MAKLIKLTQDVIEEIKKEFDTYIREKISDGRISFQKNITAVQRKATVYFTELAYRKFQALVDGFSNEVAWHGLAYRGKDESKDEYYITDILVYPQEVTGATVTTDQKKYQDWLMSQDDDTFNNVRMQGHSHVNMGVSPSGVDENLYESILAQLDDKMFYIFQIWNKKGDKTCKIYDLAKNIMFDTTDCEIKIITTVPADVKIEGATDEEQSAMLEALKNLRYKKLCEQFVAEAKKLVTTRTFTTPSSPKTYYGGYGNYGNYDFYKGYYGSSQSPSAATTPTLAATKNEDANGKNSKRKGRRKDSPKSSNQSYIYDDEDDIYGYNSRLWT